MFDKFLKCTVFIAVSLVIYILKDIFNWHDWTAVIVVSNAIVLLLK